MRLRAPTAQPLMAPPPHIMRHSGAQLRAHTAQPRTAPLPHMSHTGVRLRGAMLHCRPSSGKATMLHSRPGSRVSAHSSSAWRALARVAQNTLLAAEGSNAQTAARPRLLPLAVSAAGEPQGQLEEHREASEAEGEVLLAAWEILDHFNMCDIKSLPQPSLQSPEGIGALAASVQLAASSVQQEKGVLPLLGICAGSPRECHVSAQEWTAALGFDDLSQEASWQSQLRAMEGPVYLKLNVATRSCQASPYPGKYRGVIIQLADKQVGHLPLQLFGTSTYR